MDKKGINRLEAVKTFEGEYMRGYIMHVVPPVTTIDESGASYTTRKADTRIMNSRDGYTYTVTEAGRALELLKELPWEDTLKEVNDLHNVESGVPAG